MKKYYSLTICIIIGFFLLLQRYSTLPAQKQNVVVTTWDALGYYMYLPAIVIYNDYKELTWLDSIDRQYHTIQGSLYQAGQASNGNYVFKYLGGVALLQLPFFLVAHFLARSTGYPADGFSLPYQVGVIVAALFYALLGIFVLRIVLRRYFDDSVTAIVLLLICVATNFPQYAAVDSGMSHIYIFPLYALVLHFTIKWHERPARSAAIAIGYIVGLATICRPTEAVMLFIPLLWHTHNKEQAAHKWALVNNHKHHIWFTVLGGLAGILPQLIYWKSASGKWIYDVGSAWDFLTPHLRVLFGWEKGWFIYTPVTIFFIVGMFFTRRYEFRKSVFWFCLLNIYIIISWRDWQYGGSYSTRALVQSYPIFALPFAAFIQYIATNKWRWLFYTTAIFLVVVNIFQLRQYADTTLHYKDMNRRYYGAIYLDANPTPLDMSLLDHDEVLHNTNGYTLQQIHNRNTDTVMHLQDANKGVLFQKTLPATQHDDQWVLVSADITVDNGFWEGYLNIELLKDDSVLHAKSRLFSPISKEGEKNQYELHARVPEQFRDAIIKVYVNRTIPENLDCKIHSMQVTLCNK